MRGERGGERSYSNKTRRRLEENFQYFLPLCSHCSNTSLKSLNSRRALFHEKQTQPATKITRRWRVYSPLCGRSFPHLPIKRRSSADLRGDSTGIRWRTRLVFSERCERVPSSFCYPHIRIRSPALCRFSTPGIISIVPVLRGKPPVPISCHVLLRGEKSIGLNIARCRRRLAYHRITNETGERRVWAAYKLGGSTRQKAKRQEMRRDAGRWRETDAETKGRRNTPGGDEHLQN